MEKLKKVKVILDPPIILNDDGYPELMGKIQEAVAEGDEEASHQVTSVTLELEPATGVPQPLTGDLESSDAPDKEQDQSAE